MPYEDMLALTGIMFASVWTPGPNNAMLSASGARFGYRRTLPHVLGVSFGFPLMLFAVAMGLGEVFERSSLLQDVMRYVGAALLMYVAFKIATAGHPGTADAVGKPFTFLQAAGFQWINPKAWAMAIGMVAQFVTGESVFQAALIASGIGLTAGLTSSNGWTLLGVWLQKFLSTELRFRVFSVIMAALIALGVIFLLLH